MNPATARPWAREAVRSLVRNQVGNSIAVHNLSNKVSPLSASTLELQPMKSTVGQARATASNTSRTALTPSVKVSVRRLVMIYVSKLFHVALFWFPGTGWMDWRFSLMCYGRLFCSPQICIRAKALGLILVLVYYKYYSTSHLD